MRSRSSPARTAGLAALCALSLSTCGEAPRARPDVVLICVDTLRADRLSAYGYDRPTSPFLSRLAEEGTLFEDVTCQFAWTMPSMVSLFTGRYVTQLKATLTEDDHSLAESFQAAGYRTVAVIANGLVSERAGFAQGFDHFDSTEREGPNKERSRPLDELARDLWAPLEEALARRDAEGRPLGTDDELGAGGALDIAPTGERDPVFLYLHPFDPHDPYQEHPRLAAELPADGAEPVLPRDWQARTLSEHDVEPESPARSWSQALGRLHEQRGHYDREVRFTDDQLAAIFARLEALGLLENAVVALVSDHGEGLWEHVAPYPPDDLRTMHPRKFFYQTHGATLFEEATATPLILWGRGVASNRRIAAPVENVDLVPTLLELADVPGPRELDGRSLVELMRSTAPPESWRKYVFAAGVHGSSVREVATGLKLIVPLGASLVAGVPLQLFHLPTDEHERHNLASERPQDVVRLKRVYDAWLEEHPTASELEYQDDLRAREQAAHAEMLEALGYTEFDTGIATDGG